MRKLTTEEFISRSKEVWGDRWDYSQTEYTTANSKLILTCRAHGNFSQKASANLSGNVGCPGCRTNFGSTSKFISKAEGVWGNRWDYSKVAYTSNSSKVEIICRDHGPFHQSPQEHLVSVGCSQCHGRHIGTDEFISKALEIWGDRWDYSESIYVNNSTKVKIRCPEHGPFYQTPAGHYKGNGCPKCNGRGVETEDFIAKATQTWGSSYDYSNSKYISCRTPLDIHCLKHGVDFKQPPDSHYAGRTGCPSCRNGVSSGESSIREFVRGQVEGVEVGVRNLLPSGQELDIVVPSLKIAIEFNGVYWHSSRFRDVNYHLDKLEECRGLGLRLLQVWEDDWRDRRPQVEEHIKQLLGTSNLPRVHARKTNPRIISRGDAQEFLDRTHIQGWVASSQYVGLFAEDSLVAVASFKYQGDDLYLTRYATAALVRGGHSKIIRWVEQNLTYSNLVTFADLTFSEGDLYKSTGWMQDKTIPPDYMYVIRNSREHKFKYRKKKFETDPKLKYVPGMTERELAELNGLLRIYDAGKIRFIKPHPIL